jgi:DNA polymerase-3 subunit delta
MGAPPVVYLLHGDDEVGIKATIESIREKMGDRSTADMNTTRLTGRVELRDLKAAVRAMPFLSERRLIVLEGALGTLRSKTDREDFLKLLDETPASTALVITESAVLKSGHWLAAWAEKNTDRALNRAMPLPRGGALVRWVVDHTRKAGGEMTFQAAQHLVNLIGDDNRMAAAEADKLLAYVNYDRPVDGEDVDLLTAPIQQGDGFKMVDALGARNGRQALTLLQDLLATRDGLSIFGMIVRQVRLLLLYKELQIERVAASAAAKALSVHDFVLSKIAAQAVNFDIDTLEGLYRQLAEIDTGIKTGGVEIEIALNTFVASVTAPARSPR